MAFKFKIVKRSMKVDLPSFPSVSSDTEPEHLTGSVQGKTASAPEERLAKAFDKSGIQYLFRHVVGAPKGLPGWKELDFLVSANGLMYAVEVDTAFTHRNKQNEDILHDAIVMNDPEVQTMGELYPQVQHVSGDEDLADQDKANQYVKTHYKKSVSTFGRANEYEEQEGEIVEAVSPTTPAAKSAPQVTKKTIGSKKANKKEKEKKNKQKAQKAKKNQQKVVAKRNSVDRKIERMDR